MGLFDFLFKQPKQNINLLSLQRDLEILNDCAELMENTVNPETFFSRYDLYIEKLTLLATAETSGVRGVKFHGESFVRKLDQVNIPEERISFINAFIDRMWADTCKKAAQLKTDNGRQNRYRKFYDTLHAYQDRMPVPCIEHYLGLKCPDAEVLSEPQAGYIVSQMPQPLPPAQHLIPAPDGFTLKIQGWYISLSFGESSSKNYHKALALAKAAPQYYEQTDNGNLIHQAFYSSSEKDYLAFIMLYELVGGWKSSFVIINGDLVDRKIVGKLNYCYGDKCRSNNKRFCYGASYFTENPFGCHRLQISAANSPWWSFYKKAGNKYVLDEQNMLEKINATAKVFHYCPCFDYSRIIAVFNQLPRTLSAKKMKEITDNPLSLNQIDYLN